MSAPFVERTPYEIDDFNSTERADYFEAFTEHLAEQLRDARELLQRALLTSAWMGTDSLAGEIEAWLTGDVNKASITKCELMTEDEFRKRYPKEKP